MVRLWVLFVPCLLLAGCLVPEPPQVISADEPSTRELAWLRYTERHPDRADDELRAIVAYEALDLDNRMTERRTFPDGAFLAPGQGDRLDGGARSWVYIYAAPTGLSSGHVHLRDGEWVGSSWTSGTSSASFEHYDAGQAVGQAHVSSTEAAAVARATGAFDDVLADPGWDLSTTLQQRTGAQRPIWAFEAFARDGSGFRTVAVDATSGELVDSATESTVTTDTVAWSAWAPTANPGAVLDVPELGYDWLVIDIPRASSAWTIYGPDGVARNGPPAFRDPMPGEWHVVYEGSMPLVEAVEVRFCLLERSPFEDDGNRSCT